MGGARLISGLDGNHRVAVHPQARVVAVTPALVAALASGPPMCVPMRPSLGRACRYLHSQQCVVLVRMTADIPFSTKAPFLGFCSPYLGVSHTKGVHSNPPLLSWIIATPQTCIPLELVHSW